MGRELIDVRSSLIQLGPGGICVLEELRDQIVRVMSCGGGCRDGSIREQRVLRLVVLNLEVLLCQYLIDLLRLFVHYVPPLIPL